MAAKKRRGKKASKQAPPRLWVPKLGMFLLRVFTGALFLDTVYFKLWLTRMRAPEDGGLGLGLFDAFEHFVDHDYKVHIQRAVETPPVVLGSTWQWWSDMMESVFLPGAVPYVVGPAVLVFELLLGLSLVLGAGVRLFAGLGALLMLVFGLNKAQYLLTIQGINWILCFVLIALATAAAGRMWGLDSRLSRRLPGWVS